MKWEYLHTEPFLSRYVLAGYYLRNCSTVIEVGGYKNCIAEFLPDTTRVIAIDPLLDIRSFSNVTELKISVSDFVNKEKDFGFVFLGLDIYSDKAFDKVCEMILTAKISVIEFAYDFKKSNVIFERIVHKTGKQPKLNLLLDLSQNALKVGGYPPFYRRFFTVL